MRWRERPRAQDVATAQVTLEYEVRPEPRWGYGRAPHEHIHRLLERGRADYAETLRSFLRFQGEMLRFPAERQGSELAYWLNDHFTGLDVVALYSFLALRRPASYVEVGSGFSTAFARKALSDHRLPSRVMSIDPQPRADIDPLVDESIRLGLEDVDLSVFEELGRGDVLFVDGSHRCFTNSDVTVFFLEVLPRLRDGVLVGIHDIFLPLDYPPEWSDRWYSEQYVLGTLLLAPTRRFEIVLPSAFVSRDSELHGILDPIWNALSRSIDRSGTAFWLEIEDA